jgi:hypothetical protein
VRAGRQAACSVVGSSGRDRGVQKTSLSAFADIRQNLLPDTPIEVWFQDEMRVGQKNKLTYRPQEIDDAIVTLAVEQPAFAFEPRRAFGDQHCLQRRNFIRPEHHSAPRLCPRITQRMIKRPGPPAKLAA